MTWSTSLKILGILVFTVGVPLAFVSGRVSWPAYVLIVAVIAACVALTTIAWRNARDSGSVGQLLYQTDARRAVTRRTIDPRRPS